MGGILCCCAGQAACCAGEAFCRVICCACKACGVNPKNFAKISYVLFDTFWVAISILLMFTLQPLFEKYDYLLECNEESGGGSACFGTSAVLRMSFVLFIFHLMILLTILPKIPCSSIFHDGCWTIKFLIVVAIYIAVFWIPNNFYWGWAHFARIVSGLYLIIQVILLIIVAYSLNDKLVGEFENGNGCLGGVLISITTIFTLGSIAFIVMQYIWFRECAGPIVIVTYTLVFVIIFYALIPIRTRKDSSIFTSSMVSAYVVFLSWSAIASMPDEQCNPFLYKDENLVSQIIIGGFFTFSSLIGISVLTTNKNVKSGGPNDNDKKIGENAKYVLAEDMEEAKPENLDNVEVNGQVKSPRELGIFPITSSTLIFQFIMLLASLYYPMLITNWGDPKINDNKSNFFQANWISFWVKLCSQWVCIALYSFSLLAPLLCKNRDFY
ncbi:UNKNOWN [Stylonychia lemnae]|uniref:Serine incorporator n=1 Tax=Stylonychia lemnae TaxID=5949 RepID=A0A078AR41_STYLE|nr:UNKNOWN [Stylonychia lemnae]|eukprot:CDW84436.1 UNKNOWN [Stylonychia lemnae]